MRAGCRKVSLATDLDSLPYPDVARGGPRTRRWGHFRGGGWPPTTIQWQPDCAASCVAGPKPRVGEGFGSRGGKSVTEPPVLRQGGPGPQREGWNWTVPYGRHGAANGWQPPPRTLTRGELARGKRTQCTGARCGALPRPTNFRANTMETPNGSAISLHGLPPDSLRASAGFGPSVRRGHARQRPPSPSARPGVGRLGARGRVPPKVLSTANWRFPSETIAISPCAHPPQSSGGSNAQARSARSAERDLGYGCTVHADEAEIDAKVAKVSVPVRWFCSSLERFPHRRSATCRSRTNASRLANSCSGSTRRGNSRTNSRGAPGGSKRIKRSRSAPTFLRAMTRGLSGGAHSTGSGSTRANPGSPTSTTASCPRENRRRYIG